jgi:hypothetical protein
MLFLSLFLAFGKRKAEMAKVGTKARATLNKYMAATVDKYLTIFAGAVIISYALYTLDPLVSARFGNRLVYSVVFVIYGVLRYMAELDRSGDYDDPTENLYKDRPLILACAAYSIYILMLARPL